MLKVFQRFGNHCILCLRAERLWGGGGFGLQKRPSIVLNQVVAPYWTPARSTVRPNPPLPSTDRPLRRLHKSFGTPVGH
jgi:hypothetical protein